MLNRTRMDAAERRGKTGTITQAQGETMPEEQYAFFEEHAESVQEAAAIYHVQDRRGALPKGWRWITLREIAEIVGGVTKGQKRRPDERTRLVPYLRVANVQRGYLDLTEMKLIEAREAEIQALQLQPGDILFNEGGDRDKLGRGWIWNGELPECIHQNHVFRARLRDGRNSPKFISFYSNSAGQKYFWDEGKHTTNLASINLTKLGALPIPLPPTDEQRRIVSELERQFTRLDAGGASLKRVQTTLKHYRASVLKAAYEGRLIPKGAAWVRTTLGGVSAVLAGCGFPERLQGRKSGDVAFFKVGDISAAWKRNEKTLTRANHYISKTDLVELRAKLLPTGTVVFAKIGAAIALNRRALVGEPSLVDNNVMGLAAGNQINSRFLFHFVCTLKLDKLSRATTVPSIRKGDVEGIALDLPPLAEQLRIVAEVERRLSVIEEIETAVAASLQRAARLRQAILQRAFSGQLG